MRMVQSVVGNTAVRIGILVIAVGVLMAVKTPPAYLGVAVGLVIVLDVLRMLMRLHR